MSCTCRVQCICKWKISREESSMKLKKKYCQALLSSKLGDGGFYKNGNGDYYFGFVCKELMYLKFKRDFILKRNRKLRLLGSEPITKVFSGYKEGSYSYSFRTNRHRSLKSIAEMSVEEAIDNLDLDGLIMFYLEDGTYHKNKHFMHIYCNTFTIEECNYLIEKIYKFYPIKKCAIRYDRKKDGRKYPYIYIPVSVSNIFKLDVLEFIRLNDLACFLYKVGDSPSTTIENTNNESV